MFASISNITVSLFYNFQMNPFVTQFVQIRAISVSHLGNIRIEYKLKKTKILRTTSFKWVPSLSWQPVPLNGCRFILYVYLN